MNGINGQSILGVLFGSNCMVVSNNAPGWMRLGAKILHFFIGDAVGVCDSVADDVQIQAAINVIPGGGGKVLLSSGTFNLAADVSLNGGVTFEGMGGRIGGTLIAPAAINLNLIKIIGLVGSRKSEVIIRNICFGAAGFAGVTNIKLDYADEVLLDTISSVNGSSYGLYVSNSRRLQCRNSVFAGNVTSVYLTLSPDAHFEDILMRSDTGDSFVYSGAISAEDGGLELSKVVIISNTGGYALKLQGLLSVQLSQIEADTCVKGIYIDNSTFVQGDEIWVGFITGATQNGITLGAGGALVQYVELSKVIVNHTTNHGVYAFKATDSIFSDVLVVGCAADGFRFGSASSRNSLINSSFINNGSVAGSGISAGQDGSVFSNSIVGNRCYDTRAGGAKTQAYGMRLTGFSAINEVAHNDFTGNLTSTLLISQGDKSNYIHQNRGFIDRGEERSISEVLTKTGSTLVNGTGTFTGSPVTLLPGANVVACTVAGTATITLPAGSTGTCASGTMAVTGSPVALVGGTNVITTTGAIGNINVTINAIGVAIACPETQNCLVRRIEVDITTPGGTATSVIQVGTANDAIGTGLGAQFFTAIDANAAAIRDSFLAGDTGAQTKFVAWAATGAGSYVVAQIQTAIANNLVGRVTIYYVGR